MNDMKFFKAFRNCAQSKENTGYTEWSAMVNAELAKLSEDNLTNMLKRFQWMNYKTENEIKGFFSKVFSTFAQYIFVFLPLLISIQATHQQALLEIQNLRPDKSIDSNSYVEIFGEWNMNMMSVCFISVVVVVVVLGIVFIADMIIDRKSKNKALYAKEMQTLIGLERKNRNKIQKGKGKKTKHKQEKEYEK